MRGTARLAAIVTTLTLGSHAAIASPVDQVLAITATGTLTPGLPTTGCVFQAVTFTGTAIGAGLDSGVYSLAFTGESDACETLASGSGSGTLSGDVEGTATYERTGSTVTVAGKVTDKKNNDTKTIATAVCVVVVTAFNPVAGFAMFCVWQLTKD